MSRQTLINEIGEWLIDQALDKPDITEMFDKMCVRLHGVGVPIKRARLTWTTLHPLFRAETVFWNKGEETIFEQFAHQQEVSEEWLRSPMYHIVANEMTVMRRNLDGPNEMLDFPILHELKEQGFTDYLIIATELQGHQRFVSETGNPGIIVTYASDRDGGFSDDDIAALKKIQRRFAVACKTLVQDRIANNITQTYIGRHAGKQVLDGRIKLGDGERINAIVWYCDMRNSTSLADTMEPDALLDLLNDYFEATAGAAIEYGGEVLDFIGDAVLAIFPYDDEAGKAQAVRLSTMALEQAQRRAAHVNEQRKADGKVQFRYGVGITAGELMFGNIGVPARLAFTVIGPVVNEVERMETLTKSLDATALVSAEIAEHAPELWRSAGIFELAGVATKRELFYLIAEEEIETVPMEEADPAAIASQTTH